MYRAAAFAVFASSALIAGAAEAQQVCCVPAPAPQSVCCANAGLRGGEPTYGPPPGYGQQGPNYAPPRYPDRPPSSGLRGYIGVEYSKARLEPGTPGPRVETWTGEAAVSGTTRGLGVQGDLKIASYDTVGAGASGTAWSPTLHVFQRSAYGLIGGWAGYSHTKGANLYGLGVEGQAYMSGATLYGSVGYGHVNDKVDQNLMSARLEGRYFISENFSVGVQGGLVRASASGKSTTVRTISASAEFQPDSLPFSIRAGYSHADASNSSAESNTLRVGLRWNFDGGSLAERDRLGPSLNNVTDQFSSN